MRLALLPLLLAILSAGIGCAQQKLTIKTDPPGGVIELNDQPWGRGPVTRDFTWYGNYSVTVRLEGYETIKTTRKLIAPWYMWPPFDLFSEMFGAKVEREWTFQLHPAASQPATAPLLSRAEDLKGMLESSEYTRKPTTATAPTTKGK